MHFFRSPVRLQLMPNSDFYARLLLAEGLVQRSGEGEVAMTGCQVIGNGSIVCFYNLCILPGTT